MGILFVLILWGIVGVIAVAAGTLLVRGFILLVIRPSSDDVQKSARDRAIRKATLFPVACLVWAVFIFVFQGFVNATYLDRDIGIGDSSYCPLPHGYSLLMIDVDDQGTVYKTNGSTSDQDGAISGVKELQVSGTHFFGGSDSQYVEHFGQNNPPLNRYFLLDTQTGKHIDFATEDALRAAASKWGVTLKLEPIFEVYRRNRFTWFDGLAVALLILPPLVFAGFLIASVMRVRRISVTSSHDQSLSR